MSEDLVFSVKLFDEISTTLDTIEKSFTQVADDELVYNFNPQTSNFSLPTWYNSREVMPLAA